MGYAVYRVSKNGDVPRWGGYGVPAYCEYPDCNEEIDRGMAYACGGEPFSELGCDRYFCGKHKEMVWFKSNEDEEAINNRCDHEDDCDCVLVELCERCAKGEQPFPYKQEHPDWVKHLLTDESWGQWREENPSELEAIEKLNEIP